MTNGVNELEEGCDKRAMENRFVIVGTDNGDRRIAF